MRKKKLMNCLLFLFLFWGLYQPSLIGMSATIYIPLLCVLFMILFLPKYISSFKKSITGNFFGAIVFIWIYMLFVDLILSGDNLVFKSIIHILFAIVYVYGIECFTLKYKTRNIESVLLIVGYTQSFLCVVMFLVPGLKNMQLAYLIRYSAAGINESMVFRYYGVAGANQYLSSIGTVSALLCIWAFYKAIEQGSLIKTFGAFFLLVPAILDARTGVVCAIIGIFVIWIAHLFAKQYSRGFLWITLTGIAFLLSILCAYFVLQKNEKIDMWVGQALRAIRALLIGDTSCKEYEWYGGLLPTNWILPQGINFVFGTGKLPSIDTTKMSFVGMTDSGFVRLIYTGGVVLLFLQLIIMVRVVKGGQKKYNAVQYAILACLLVSEMKGNVYIQTPVIILLLLMSIEMEDTRRLRDEGI